MKIFKFFSKDMDREVFGPLTLIKIGTIQRRLAWPLHKDDTKSLRRKLYGAHFFFAFFPFENIPILDLIEILKFNWVISNLDAGASAYKYVRAWEYFLTERERAYIHMKCATVWRKKGRIQTVRGSGRNVSSTYSERYHFAKYLRIKRKQSEQRMTCINTHRVEVPVPFNRLKQKYSLVVESARDFFVFFLKATSFTVQKDRRKIIVVRSSEIFSLLHYFK
ncbi:hypothetical protein BD770DRAFT_411485 [Pilaira anomala]|nr:hypothetical protein BD770DRAFT_411485 [Pilaira anomala]